MLSFFEFSCSFKNVVTFLGLFIVFVSVLSILLFFRPNSPDKADNECCLIENPKKFFNLDCKPVFNNLVQFTSFVYGTLLIQYLNAHKSITLVFFSPQITTSNFPFLCFRCKSASSCKDG